MSTDKPCIFCKIATGSIKSEKLLETEGFIVIRDIHPQAPVHLLAIPKLHIPSVAEANEGHRIMLGQILLGLADSARKLNIDENGYRIVINTRAHGGQEVGHLHIHLLGGEPLGPMRAR